MSGFVDPYRPLGYDYERRKRELAEQFAELILKLAAGESVLIECVEQFSYPGYRLTWNPGGTQDVSDEISAIVRAAEKVVGTRVSERTLTERNALNDLDAVLSNYRNKTR
jgi:hypothetical protein